MRHQGRITGTNVTVRFTERSRAGSSLTLFSGLGGWPVVVGVVAGRSVVVGVCEGFVCYLERFDGVFLAVDEK